MAHLVSYYHLKRLKAKDKYALKKKISYKFLMRIRVVMDMRITSVMRNRNFVINHRTVQRLMQSMGIKSRIRKVRYRSIRANLVESCTNIINSDFVA